MIGHANLAARQGRAEQVTSLLDEAEAVAGDAGADGVLGWVSDARGELAG